MQRNTAETIMLGQTDFLRTSSPYQKLLQLMDHAVYPTTVRTILFSVSQRSWNSSGRQEKLWTILTLSKIMYMVFSILNIQSQSKVKAEKTVTATKENENTDNLVKKTVRREGRTMEGRIGAPVSSPWGWKSYLFPLVLFLIFLFVTWVF